MSNQSDCNSTKYTNETDKTKLLNFLGSEEQGVLHRDRIVMRLFELNINDLIQSFDKTTQAIENATKASNSLGRKVLWLNIVLGFATVAGLIVGVISLIK